MDEATFKIHRALEAVSLLRQQRATQPALAAASGEIKRFQSARFEATYTDLLRNPRYAAVARFFLSELYNDNDYSERDQQFARIAATITRLFPKSVADTAATLAEVHMLSETLDDAMARQWLVSAADSSPDRPDCRRYVLSWRAVADRPTRLRQLETVLQLGQSLDRLTRLPGLRTLLRMMRRPANAAGLSSLQRFLENGFDAFATMRGAAEFLDVIGKREAQWIDSLFGQDLDVCEAGLRELMDGQARH